MYTIYITTFCLICSVCFYSRFLAIFVQGDKSKGATRGLQNIVMQLKKACNHPYLCRPNDNASVDELIQASGKMVLLDRYSIYTYKPYVCIVDTICRMPSSGSYVRYQQSLCRGRNFLHSRNICETQLCLLDDRQVPRSNAGPLTANKIPLES